jgi:hypothetical protein
MDTSNINETIKIEKDHEDNEANVKEFLNQ